METELDKAIYEYRKALADLKIAVEKAIKSHNDKIRAVERVAPFLKGLSSKINKK